MGNAPLPWSAQNEHKAVVEITYTVLGGDNIDPTSQDSCELPARGTTEVESGENTHDPAKVNLKLVRIFLNLPDGCFICLNCIEVAFLVPSYRLGCLSFTLVRSSPQSNFCLNTRTGTKADEKGRTSLLPATSDILNMPYLEDK